MIVDIDNKFSLSASHIKCSNRHICCHLGSSSFSLLTMLGCISSPFDNKFLSSITTLACGTCSTCHRVCILIFDVCYKRRQAEKVSRGLAEPEGQLVQVSMHRNRAIMQNLTKQIPPKGQLKQCHARRRKLGVMFFLVGP